MSNFPSGCSKTTKWVTESTNGCSKTTKRVTESTNDDPISTKWVPPKIQNGVRQLYVAVMDGVIIADKNGASDINDDGQGSKLFRAN